MAANGFQLREIERAVKKVCGYSLRSRNRSKTIAAARKAFYLMSLQLTSCTHKKIARSIGFCHQGVGRIAREGPTDEITKIMVEAGDILFKDVDFCDLPKQATMPWHTKGKKKA